MKFIELPLSGSYVIELSPVVDKRGWFTRTYCKNEFAGIGHTKEWVQINHSFTEHTGTIRGMHYQIAPYREIKLLRCVAGSVYDVIVDLRKDSTTFLQWFGMELSASNKKMLYIPEGFAHGFQTLSENVELLYHHSEFYTPEAEAGIHFNDARIKIEWPLPVNVISERDAAFPYLNSNFNGI